MYIIYVFDITCKNLGGVRVSNSNLSNSLKKVNKNRLSAIPTPPLKLPLLQWEI